jgi:hypothetical protein
MNATISPRTLEGLPARTGYLPVHRARQHLQDNGQTLDDWEGICGELANAVIGPNDHIVHVEPACLWKYHMVPIIDDLVHDAWCDGPPIPIKEWLIRLCDRDVVTVAIDGVDIYSGPAGDFEEDNESAQRRQNE